MDMSFHNKSASLVSGRVNKNKPTSTPITVKLKSMKDKVKSLESYERKDGLTAKEWQLYWELISTSDTGRQWSTISEMPRENYHQFNTLYQAKPPFKREDEMKTFLDS